MLLLLLSIFVTFSASANGAQQKHPSVELKNAAVPGTMMPLMGLGTGGYGHTCSDPSTCCDTGSYPEIWDSTVCPDTASNATLAWLQMGGVRIDEANSYNNEDSCARGIEASGLTRDQFFLTSKLGPSLPLGFNETLDQIANTLKTYNTDHVDLLLVHWPLWTKNSSDPLCNYGASTYDEKECRLSVWKAMEIIFKEGKAKAIGVSNYNTTHLQEMVDAKMLLPAVNQCPFNPHLSTRQQDVVEWCKENQILFNGYSPLGVPDAHAFPSSLNMQPTLLQEPVVERIARSHKRSPAEVLLAWQVFDQGIAVNPRTNDPAHMQENLAAVTNPPALTDAENKQLASMVQDNCSGDKGWYECDGTHYLHHSNFTFGRPGLQ